MITFLLIFALPFAYLLGLFVGVHIGNRERKQRTLGRY